MYYIAFQIDNYKLRDRIMLYTQLIRIQCKALQTCMQPASQPASQHVVTKIFLTLT